MGRSPGKPTGTRFLAPANRLADDHWVEVDNRVPPLGLALAVQHAGQFLVRGAGAAERRL